MLEPPTPVQGGVFRVSASFPSRRILIYINYSAVDFQFTLQYREFVYSLFVCVRVKPDDNGNDRKKRGGNSDAKRKQFGKV